MASSRFDRRDSWDKEEQIDSPFQDETFFSEEEADYAAKVMKNRLIDDEDESPFVQAFVDGKNQAGLPQGEEPEALYNPQGEFEEPELEEPYQPEVEYEQAEFSSAGHEGYEDQEEYWNEYDAPVDEEDGEQLNGEASYDADEQDESEHQADWGQESEQDWEDEDYGEFGNAKEEPVYKAEFDVVDDQEQNAAFEEDLISEGEETYYSEQANEDEYGLERISFETSRTVVPRVLTYTTNEVIDNRISIPAQHALVRLSKNQATSADAVGMLQEIKAGRLEGIHCVNWKKAADRAGNLGKKWWNVIPKGEDAVLMMPTSTQQNSQPLIAFRRELSPDCGLLKGEKRFSPSHAKLDKALLKAWKTYSLFRQRKIGCIPIQGEVFNKFDINQIDFEDSTDDIPSNILCEPGSVCRRKNGLPNQKCLTSFRDAEAELRKNGWQLPNHLFHTFAFDGVTVLASNGNGFNRFVGHVATSVSPYLGHGQVVFAETTNNQIPQLWAIYVPNSLNFRDPVPTHVFFAPNPTPQMTASPYPYGQEWNRFVDRYLIGKQKRLLQQLKASGKKTLLIFPIARPAKVSGAPIYGILSSSRELRKSLMDIVCWLGNKIPQQSTSPILGYCSVSGFSAAGHTLRGIMDSSNAGEFPELTETYFLDIVTTAWNPHSVQRWLSKSSRFGQRYIRIYTSYSEVANNRQRIFIGKPIRENAYAKEWQVNNGTLIYTPPPFWDSVFNEHGKSTSPDYDRISAHQAIPCVFLEHSLRNSGFQQ